MEAERNGFTSASDEHTLKALARATADSRVDLLLNQRTTEKSIEQLLTDEQKAQLEQHKVDREEKRAKRMERKQAQ